MSKKIKLTLVGLDGNAYSLMGAFQRQARKEGWTQEEIEEVLTRAKSGNYNNLIRVLSDHCADMGGAEDCDHDHSLCRPDSDDQCDCCPYIDQE